MPHRNANLRGITAIVLSQLAFLVNDTLIKLVSERLPLGEIIAFRGLFATLFVGAAVIGAGQHRLWRFFSNRFVLMRVAGELGGTFFYLIALFQMAIANVVIIFQAVPLAVTAAAALTLGERVGLHRWLAVVTGFFGVALVIRPGLDGFDAAGLLILVCVLFVSLREIATRRMPARIPTLLLSLFTGLAVALMGLAIGLTETWLLPTAFEAVSLAGAGLFLALGYLTAIVAMRVGEISVSAPFRYIAVVFAIGVGFLVWGDRPDVLTILGSAVIVGSGLYMLHREALAGAVRPTPLSAE